MPGKLKFKSKRKKLNGKEREQKQRNKSFPDEEIGKYIEDEMPSAEKYLSDSMHAFADMQLNLFHLKNTLSMVESSLDDLNEGIRKLDERIWDICNDILRWETGENQLEVECDRINAEEMIHYEVANLKADIINESRRKYKFEKEGQKNIEQLKRYKAEVELATLNLDYLGKEQCVEVHLIHTKHILMILYEQFYFSNLVIITFIRQRSAVIIHCNIPFFQ